MKGSGTVLAVVTLVGVAGALAVALQSRTGAARETWMRCAFVNPGDGDQREIPPFPAPKWNPLALYESGIGRTLCGLATSNANRMEHFGIGQTMSIPFATPTARTLHWINREMVPRIHVHASEGTGFRVSEGDDVPYHHDHGAGEKIELGKAQLAYAGRRRDDYMKWAYQLDPTNEEALAVFVGSVEDAGGGSDMAVEAFGTEREVSRGRFRAIQLCRYSLARFRVTSGYWPEQCLNAAKAVQLVWLAFEAGNTDYDRESAEERNERVGRMATLADEIDKLLLLAESQKQELETIGLWERRSESEVKDYETNRQGLQALVKLFRDSRDRQLQIQ